MTSLNVVMWTSRFKLSEFGIFEHKLFDGLYGLKIHVLNSLNPNTFTYTKHRHNQSEIHRFGHHMLLFAANAYPLMRVASKDVRLS